MLLFGLKHVFATKQLIIGLICEKIPINIRHPMHLRHPVRSIRIVMTYKTISDSSTAYVCVCVCVCVCACVCVNEKILRKYLDCLFKAFDVVL